MKKSNVNLTCKGLVNKMNKGEINFDTSIQRGLVWDLGKKSLLIHSCIEGYPIPPMFLVKNEDGTLDSLDGKQRSNAISGFFGGEYALSVDFPLCYNDEGEAENFSGMFYEQLPEWVKDRIRDTNITCYYLEDATEAEIREMFRRLNNGKPLSATELTRVKAVSLPIFQTIAKHPAIAAATTEKGKAKFNDETLAFQVYAMAYMENPDFGTKAFRPFIENAVVTEDQQKHIESGLDMLASLIDTLAQEPKENKENARVYKRIKAKTHFVSMAYLAMMAAENGAEQDDFNSVVYDFFKTSATTTSAEYNKHIGAGAASPTAVQGRKSVVKAMAQEMGYTISNF